MPSKKIRSSFPSVTGGGGGPNTTILGFTDSFFLNIVAEDTVPAQTDDATFQLAFLQADTIAAQTEAVTLNISGPGFSDTNAGQTDAVSFVVRVWLSASAGTGVTNPSNANLENDGTNAVVQTALANPATETMTSSLGVNVPSGSITSAVYRGWFRSVNNLVTSRGSVIAHSSTALFTDITMFNNIALTTTIDHLDGSFNYDLFAAGVNTTAKLQSLEIYHQTQDAAAGVTPHVLTVDAGCLDVVGAFGAGGTQTFSYTGAEQTFVVPGGVSLLTVDMTGAESGRAGLSSGNGQKGGRLQATLACTPGETLRVFPGGKGVNGSSGTAGAGGLYAGGNGLNGTTSGGGGGGGQSYIKQGGTTDAFRVMVAAGAGGGSSAGGSPVALQSVVAALDTQANTAAAATNASGGPFNAGGGGGGSGWRGGAGGTATGDAGDGGTSMTNTTVVTAATHTVDNRTGDGYITFTW